MIYHVFNKSIADYVIFNGKPEFDRMLKALQYYIPKKPYYNLSKFIELRKLNVNGIIEPPHMKEDKKLVSIIAYCLMPTHFHLILHELEEDGIPIYMSNILNSYARYFNIRHGRKGHLWESSYKKVLVETDEQLLHLTRYIHLNPATAYLVNKPEDWLHSSYREYLKINDPNMAICNYDDLLSIDPHDYRVFVEDRIGYQRDLAKIKESLFE